MERVEKAVDEFFEWLDDRNEGEFGKKWKVTFYEYEMRDQIDRICRAYDEEIEELITNENQAG